MNNQLDLFSKKEESVENVLQFFKKNKEKLIESIDKTFSSLSLSFENRYILHPRDLRKLGKEVAVNFINFVKVMDTNMAIEHGKQICEKGLGQKSILALGTILRQLCFDKIKDKDTDTIRKSLHHVVDVYMNACLSGYMEVRESKILKDQERLRLALSTALEKQRYELYIKNHVVHSSVIGIIISDLNERINYVNPAFLRMWGYGKSDDIVDSKIAKYWENDEGKDIRSILLENGKWESEIISERKDGTFFNVAVTASVIRDKNSQQVGFMSFFIDITKRKNLEQQFRQAQKMDALGQLAGGIIHDFNNLLTAISGYAQLELLDMPETSSYYHDVMQIKSATDRGKNLTQELRIFTRQESSDFQPTNLNKEIEQNYSLLKRTFPPGVETRLNLYPKLNIIKANSSQLSQLIVNLCVNAWDAIKSKRKKNLKESIAKDPRGLLTIQTCNVELDDADASRFLNAKAGYYVCIKVSDTGEGMGQEIIDRLYEPFFTTKDKKHGTGLGMSVVYGVVQNHLGFIDVQSKVGEGSSFSIYLPAVKNKHVKSSPVTTSLPTLKRGKGTVLVVEDEHQVRDMIIKILEKVGYSVLSADNGIEAILIYKAHRESIDLVLLDMVMPKMSGRECFHHLKKINKDVKIVIITGFTTDKSAEALIKEGAYKIITKPFELTTFTEIVQQTIDTQTIDTQTIDTQTIDTQTIDTQTIDTQTIDTQTINTHFTEVVQQTTDAP